MSVEKTATGVDNINGINNIINELKLQDFSDGEINKIMWNNWSNLLKKCLK